LGQLRMHFCDPHRKASNKVTRTGGLAIQAAIASIIDRRETAAAKTADRIDPGAVRQHAQA